MNTLMASLRTLLLIALASGCCSGFGADGSCVDEDDAAAGRIDAATLTDATAAASCTMTSPPDGGVDFMGTTVFPKQCGQDPTCTSPICWLCAQGPGGATWNLTGNEQCRPGADAGAES
jgi:hypothetical protein